MPITTVNSNQLISVDKYNEIQSSSTLVLSYYGVNATSVQVADANAIMYADNHWAKLYDDVNKCTIHQTGAVINGATRPTNTTVASVVLTNQIIDAANLAVTNKANVASGQTVSVTTSSSRSSNFGVNVAIHHTAEYEWVDASSMSYFLQSGGRLEADLNWVNSGAEFASDLIAVLQLADTAINNQSLPTRVSYANQTPSPVTFTQGAHTVTVSFTRTSTKKYTLDISILSTLLQTLNGSSITGSTRYVASTDNGTLVGGILGPVPQTTITVTFQGSAGTPTPTRALTASPTSLSYAFYTGDTQSAAQTITLTNNGNTAVNITGVTYTTAGTVIPRPTYSWTNNSTFANTTINPSASRTISLAYSGGTAGTFNNSVTIANDGNQPSLIVSASQVISGFSLNPIPASLTPTVVNLNKYEQQFVILNSNVSPVLASSYTSSLSGTDASKFSIVNADAGPKLIFDPSGKLNSTSTVTISISLNNNPSFTLSRTVVLTLNVPTQNIGKWISATGNDNAVIGMSYDIIGGTKYLTVGVGMGNDGSALVAGGGGSFASADNLGINNTTRLDSDPDPSKGVPLYDYYLGDGAWVPFLKGNAETSGAGYGVSYRYHKTMQYTPDYIVRSYTFSADSVAHTYEYSVDDAGFVEISNPSTGGFDVIIDKRASVRSNYQTISTAAWTPSAAGIYTIRLNTKNTGYPGAVALRITNNTTNQVIWSTQVPVRTAYQYWAEVYRIPLTQGAHTYSSKGYIVKDSAITIYEGMPYGNFFEGQSLFSVTDDGVGNLTVTINPIGGSWPVNSSDQLTVSSIRDLAYYFSDYHRITNLTNPSTIAATQTLRFDGFQADGSVRTTIVDKPASDPYQTITTGGGGCPDPGVLITLADRTTKPAGEIQVGDLLYAMHEHTREFGVYPVTAMDIEEQPMVNIVFTDKSTLSVSRTHKFLMATGNWKQVFELGEGSVIKGLDFDKTIQTVDTIGLAPAVKITVADAHTYIADGLISHNIKAIEQFTTLAI